MHHTDADNAAAAKKALELLNAKELEVVSNTSACISAVPGAGQGSEALNKPMIGDGLVKSDTDPTFWMQAIMSKGPKLDMKDLKQQAAMPLASFLRFDPWTDQVYVMHSSFEPLLTAADKMPFEVEPVYLKLSYYKALADVPASPATAAPATTPPAQHAAAPAAATTAPATPPTTTPQQQN